MSSPNPAGLTSPTGFSETSGTARSRRRWCCGQWSPTPTGRPPAPYDPLSVSDRGLGRARVIDERGHGVQITSIARMAAAAEPVLVLVADVTRRAAMLTGPLDPARFGVGRDHARRLCTGRGHRRSRAAVRSGRGARSTGDLGGGRAARRTGIDDDGTPGVGRGRDRLCAVGRRAPRASARDALRVVWKAEKAGAAEHPAGSRDGRPMPGGTGRGGAGVGRHGISQGRPRSCRPPIAKPLHGWRPLNASWHPIRSQYENNYNVTMATVPRSPEAERHDHLLAELLGHVTEYNPDADAGLIQPCLRLRLRPPQRAAAQER